MEDQRRIVLQAAELNAMIEKSAEEGAKRALAAVGLHDEDAANDVRDLRQVMSDYRAVKRGILTAVGNAVVLGILALIGTGIWWHLHKPSR